MSGRMFTITAPVIVRLENVSTVYEGERRPAIHDITLTLTENELVYVIGPNASGKTTLLETINGLLSSFIGQVYVFGVNITTQGRHVRCNVGYVPQDFMVEPGEPYTAFDIVLMGRYGKIGVLQRPTEQDQHKARDAMQLLDIAELADRPMGKLSGGQQQKVMLARAIAKEPRLLLLDEPFSNFDPESRQQIPAVLSRLHTEQQLTTIIVTHDIRTMLKPCRRVIVMNTGRIVVDAAPDVALKQWEVHL
jgi:zinc/manganese transport system ATP-binding protein